MVKCPANVVKIQPAVIQLLHNHQHLTLSGDMKAFTLSDNVVEGQLSMRTKGHIR